MDALPKDLNKIKDDPTANPAARNLASSIKNLYNNVLDLPEWKKDTLAQSS